jgi:hypothetical protein
MSDARYDNDDAYRMDVMRKLERSNLKVWTKSTKPTGKKLND